MISDWPRKRVGNRHGVGPTLSSRNLRVLQVLPAVACNAIIPAAGADLELGLFLQGLISYLPVCKEPLSVDKLD